MRQKYENRFPKHGSGMIFLIILQGLLSKNKGCKTRKIRLIFLLITSYYQTMFLLSHTFSSRLGFIYVMSLCDIIIKSALFFELRKMIYFIINRIIPNI